MDTYRGATWENMGEHGRCHPQGKGRGLKESHWRHSGLGLHPQKQTKISGCCVKDMDVVLL